MTTKDLDNISNNYSTGQKIRCLKPLGGEKQVPCEAIILSKHRYFALVTDNHKWRWCVLWADLMIYNGLYMT